MSEQQQIDEYRTLYLAQIASATAELAARSMRHFDEMEAMDSRDEFCFIGPFMNVRSINSRAEYYRENFVGSIG